MKHILYTLTLFTLGMFPTYSHSQNHNGMQKYNELNPEEKHVILNKGTEAPFTGKYNKHYEKGTYVCRQCNTPLYHSSDKFKSDCGWPSFDDEIEGAVTHKIDRDGRRTEIICAHCKGHLGHVFLGEGYTNKDTRHCVNSLSLKFIPEEKNAQQKSKMETAFVAGGCFWGVEHFLQKVKGVVSTTVGYSGGVTDNPDYRSVSYKNTRHAETVKVVFDPTITSYEAILKKFFEIHDPTQVNRQGPDKGSQYRSEVFYETNDQQKVALGLIKKLNENGYTVATKVTRFKAFWDGEDYHQDYYKKKGSLPYCHIYTPRF